MCVFCAAIPVAAATGAHFNTKQQQAKRAAQAAGVERPAVKPIMQITGGVVFLLLVGSVTYHTVLKVPY